MEAIILAGAPNAGPLRSLSPARFEAAIMIDGRPMLDYVVAALAEVPDLERIIVVAPEAILTAAARARVAQVVPPGVSIMDSLLQGLQGLSSQQPVLVVTADLPLLTAAAVTDFISRCQKRPAELHYPFVSRQVNQASYPGVERTYVRLREGTFTGGNLVLLAPDLIGSRLAILKQAAALRKKPLQLCRKLGWRYLWQLLTGHLTIAVVEERISRMLQFRVCGIESPFPELGIDVDKPSDLRLAERVLAMRRQGKTPEETGAENFRKKI